jgi:hypothetical protein
LLHSAKGRILSGVQEALAFVALGANAIAAGWGGYCWVRGIPSTLFWPLLRVGQVLVVLLALVTGLVLLDDPGSIDGLELFYVLMPIGVNVFAEGARVNAAAAEMEGVEDFEAMPRRDQILKARRVVLREIGVMAIAELLVTTLLLRATGLF